MSDMLRKGAPGAPPRRFQRLVLERVDPMLFRCTVDNLWKPEGARGLFGGQIIGLALEAAQQTVGSDQVLHSMHCYFVRAGRNDVPLIIHVSQVHDGRSFCTREVRATQDGCRIFVLSCSFQRAAPARERSGSAFQSARAMPEFQSAMPAALQPDL